MMGPAVAAPVATSGMHSCTLTNDVLVRAMCSTDTHAELEPPRLLQVTTSGPKGQRSTPGPGRGIRVGLHLPRHAGPVACSPFFNGRRVGSCRADSKKQTKYIELSNSSPPNSSPRSPKLMPLRVCVNCH